MKGLWIKCVFATRFLVYHKETKGLETFFRLILSEKDYSSRKHYTNFPLVTLKCCCFPRKLGKQIKFVTFFCLHDRRNFRHFSNLEPKLAHAHNVFPLQKKSTTSATLLQTFSVGSNPDPQDRANALAQCYGDI